jgi:hypothetical protein
MPENRATMPEKAVTMPEKAATMPEENGNDAGKSGNDAQIVEGPKRPPRADPGEKGGRGEVTQHWYYERASPPEAELQTARRPPNRVLLP